MLRLFYSKSDDASRSIANSTQNNVERVCAKRVATTKKVKYSELIMGEQLISELDKCVKDQEMSHLTFEQYEQMDSEQKGRIQNRVRQWALKIRDVLPKDHGLFCLVLAHLLKNAHRYFDLASPSEFQKQLFEERHIS